MQPHVLVIVDKINNGSGCFYVIISPTNFYSVTSVTVAIDICFKSFFVFDSKYPAACRSSWLFLQRTVYKFATKHDFKSTKMLNLMNELGC